MLASLLFVLAGRPAPAAGNLGLSLPGSSVNLYLDFGNPTEYQKIIPGPAFLDFGPDTNYFHGVTTATLVETGPERPPSGYGGPGDSWSEILLDSPTPGSTAVTPIVFRFDSRIRNLNGTVGYWAGSANTPGNVWHFDPPGTNVHFRVEWTITVTSAYQVTNCNLVFLPLPPYTNVVCTNATLQTTGLLSAALSIEGYGLITVHSGALGPNNASLSGVVSGVAGVPHLRVAFNHEHYVGQGSRGDERAVVTYRIFADTQTLPPPPSPVLTVTRPTPTSLRISWPPGVPGFLLQTATDLTAASWVNSPTGSTNPVVLPADGPAKFFRLVRP
jgi:hypothetical protein